MNICETHRSDTTTPPSPAPEIDLPFSHKYDQAHAKQYYLKHHESMARRLSNWREIQLARRSLVDASNPETVLDLPCGAGRFWPMLGEKGTRKIYAADNSDHMLQVALTSHPKTLTDRVIPFRTSAFSIDMQDNSVDSIFCMRLLHHIADKEYRLSMLKEFHRVTRDSVVLSIWVDGNYKAFRRKRLEIKRTAIKGQSANQNRFVISRKEVESEFRQAKFQIVNHRDFLPGYAMWRFYTLKKEQI
jgi:SAM-dependent methyltransferase